MQVSFDNQERHAARQVIGGPDHYSETNVTRNAQMFRQATANTIINGTSAERYAPAGLEDDIDKLRQSATGSGRIFSGTA